MGWNLNRYTLIVAMLLMNCISCSKFTGSTHIRALGSVAIYPYFENGLHPKIQLTIRIENLSESLVEFVSDSFAAKGHQNSFLLASEDDSLPIVIPVRYIGFNKNVGDVMYLNNVVVNSHATLAKGDSIDIYYESVGPRKRFYSSLFEFDRNKSLGDNYYHFLEKWVESNTLYFVMKLRTKYVLIHIGKDSEWTEIWEQG